MFEKSMGTKRLSTTKSIKGVSFLQQLLERLSPFTPTPSFCLLAYFAVEMDSLQAWISQHKLTSISTLWASAIGASFLYTRGRSPQKPSLRLIHARLHAQALTLAVLSGAAVLHYVEKKKVEEGEKVASIHLVK